MLSTLDSFLSLTTDINMFIHKIKKNNCMRYNVIKIMFLLFIVKCKIKRLILNV